MSRSNSHLKKIKDLAASNLREGNLFMDSNAKKESVFCLDSGLQYEVLAEGTGAKPILKDKVLCHYVGTLLNGEVFDSSYQRKRPESFPVKDLIKGWQEALVHMTVGSKYKLFVPPHLGYGFDSLTANSGGNCTLIFEIELIAII